jgi:hypothetical protein
MKNHIFLAGLTLLFLALMNNACSRYEVGGDSTPQDVVLPFVYSSDMLGAYVYGQGATSLYTDLPAVVAVVVDTVFGFEGGYGGKTGADTFQIKKVDIIAWGDTTNVGGKSLGWEKFSKGGYKVKVSSALVIAGPIANPGPTALEGSYKRLSNSVLIDLKKVFDGVYVIDNLGGAAPGATTPFPYLVYNYKSTSGGDSLVFPIQKNDCGGGTQLVGPTATPGSKASDYATNFPPSIVTGPPVTLSWKVYSYSSASLNAVAPASALCVWGNAGVRTFEKQ